MSNQKSFTKFENEVVPAYRKNITAAGSSEEVKQFFARTVCELLEKAGEGQVRCRLEDIALLPATAPHYSLGESLTAQEAFQSIWKDSDLSAILARLVEQAVHRHMHLAKHPEKTNSSNYFRN